MYFVTCCWLWLGGVGSLWVGLPRAAACAEQAQPDVPFIVAVLPPEVVDDTGEVTPDVLLSGLEQALARQGLEVLPRAQVLSAIPTETRLDFNPTCVAAQALGARVGSEGYVLARLQRGERSLSNRRTVLGGTLHLFAVETRTGQLIASEHLDFIEDGKTFLPAVDEALAAAAARFVAGWRRAREQPAVEACAAGRDGAEDILDLRDGVVPPDVVAPVPRVRRRPELTEEARGAGVTATLLVEVCVGTDGQVQAVRVIRWAGYGLEAAVEKALRATRFSPARRQGKPLPAWFVAAFNFRPALAEER